MIWRLAPVAAALAAVALAACGSSATSAGSVATGGGARPAVRDAALRVHPPYAVGLRVVRLVDPSRRIRLPGGGSEPRTLLTYVRYPALGAPSGGDVRDAPAASPQGPFPLVVFGHGFDLAPTVYDRLLRAWVRAGYVVAAPRFPLEDPSAPGGPDETDLVNQPRDMSFVVSELLNRSRAAHGPLKGLIDAGAVAVAGHSDGGETALAVAYARRYRDPRVRAAVILSGAQLPGVRLAFRPGVVPLLAMQGTDDTINLPQRTYSFFALAGRPKYLLRLLGAAHEPPYTSEHPQLGVVERVSTAFLDRYLRKERGAQRRLVAAGQVRGIAALEADP